MEAAELQVAAHATASGQDRLSDLDEAFLYMERPNQPMQIGCIAEVAGRFELEELRAVLLARLGPLRRFRQRPAHSTLNLRGVAWEDDPGFDVSRHVRHVALPPPADEETLRHVVETLFATPLPPDRPLWEIHLIDGLPSGRSALLCKVHHCMSDGISALGVLERIADAVADATPEERTDCGAGNRPGASNGSGAQPSDPRPASRSLAGALASVLGRLRTLAEPANVRAAVRDVGSALDAIASFVQEPISALPFNGRLGNGRRMVWRSFPFDEFDSLRIAGDCTINDAVLTVIAGALRSYLDQEGVCPDDARVRALVPMSVRDPGVPADLGNVITALFPRLPVDEEDPLERLHRVREEMRTLKGREMGRATGVLLGLLGLLPSAVEAAALRFVPDTPLVSVAVTNVRGPARQLRLLGRPIVEIHPIMNLFQGVGLAFAVASYAGRMSICAATDPSLLPEGERVIDGVEHALYELRTEHWRTSNALLLARGLAERVTVGALRKRARAATARQARVGERVTQLDDARVLTAGDLRFAPEQRSSTESLRESASASAAADDVPSVKPEGGVADVVR